MLLKHKNLVRVRAAVLCIVFFLAGGLLFGDQLTFTASEWEDISFAITSLQPSCSEPNSCTTRIDPPATIFSDAYHSTSSNSLASASFTSNGPMLRILTNTSQTRFSDDASQLTTSTIVAEAVFQDSLFVTGAGASSLRVFYQFDGNYAYTGTTLGVLGGLLVSDSIEHARTQGTLLQTFPLTLSTNSTISLQSSTLFNFSSGSVNIAFNLGSIASCSLAQTGSCSSTADFSNTFRLTSVQVLDGNGNVLPGASLTSASGFDYMALSATPPASPPSAVPEPATFGMVLCVLASLLGRRAIDLLRFSS